MPHFKDTSNGLHWLDDPAYAALLPAGSVQIADAEADALRAPTQAELDAATNAAAKAALAGIDAASVRQLREFILAKFPGDPLLPAQLAQNDAKAATERAKLK